MLPPRHARHRLPHPPPAHRQATRRPRRSVAPAQPGPRFRVKCQPDFRVRGVSEGSLYTVAAERRVGFECRGSRDSCGILQGRAGRFGLPEAIFAQQRVEQAGEPAHDGHHGHLVGLAAGRQTLVAGLQAGLPADRGEGRHVKDSPGVGAAACVLSGVAVVGAKPSSKAAWRRSSVPNSGMSAHRQAAVRRPQPGTDPMMSARQERTASAARHSSIRRSQAAMLAWKASLAATEHSAVCGSGSAQSLGEGADLECDQQPADRQVHTRSGARRQWKDVGYSAVQSRASCGWYSLPRWRNTCPAERGIGTGHDLIPDSTAIRDRTEGGLRRIFPPSCRHPDGLSCGTEAARRDDAPCGPPSAMSTSPTSRRAIRRWVDPPRTPP